MNLRFRIRIEFGFIFLTCKGVFTSCHFVVGEKLCVIDAEALQKTAYLSKILFRIRNCWYKRNSDYKFNIIINKIFEIFFNAFIAFKSGDMYKNGKFGFAFINLFIGVIFVAVAVEVFVRNRIDASEE